MRGTIGGLIQRIAGGVSVTIDRHIAQDISAASSKTVAMAMAPGAETVTEIAIVEIGAGVAEEMAATVATELAPHVSTDTRME